MPIDTTVTTEDAPMFAAIPSWERNRKRRGFGFSAPRATRAVTPIMAEETLDPLDAPGDSFADPSTGAFATAPVYANRTAPRRTTGPAMAVMAGLIAVVGLGAAAYYAAQPHDTGMAELTPGAPSTTTAAPSTLAMNDAAAPAATTHVSSAVNPARTTTTTTTTRTARARPPASRSVDDAGVNASATLPEAPMAYTGTAVNPAPVEAPPAPTPAPVESAPAPAPVQSIPKPSVSVTPETPPQ